MTEESLDSVLLDKVMRSVRVEAVRPLRFRLSRVVKGKVTDTHEFEVKPGYDVQKEMTAVAVRWKGGFEVGNEYRLERLE